MGSNILSLNNETTFNGKYEVEDQYNLIIKNVQFQDEGIYECDTGEQRLTVALQVAGGLIQVIDLKLLEERTQNWHKIHLLILLNWNHQSKGLKVIKKSIY